jgi:hypothetical protein
VHRKKAMMCLDPAFEKHAGAADQLSMEEEIRIYEAGVGVK